MPRGKRKTASKTATVGQSDSENEGLMRRSSLKVNLSFTSNLSESDEEQNENLLKNRRGKVVAKNVVDASTPASVANVTVFKTGTDCKDSQNKPSKTPKHLITSMNEKEQQLDRSCMELKNAIMNKTQVLSDDELTKKTSEILTGCSSHVSRMNNHENRSPRVQINIGNNDQIVMAGCGKKQNLVVVNSMAKSILSEEANNNKASQDSNYNGSDYSQSIASTPKKCNIETSVDKSTGETHKQAMKIPVARLFTDVDPNDSMSEMNPVSSTETIRSNYNGNIGRMSNQLNHTVSPILSQGIRKTRTCRLSLRKRSSANETGNSRISTSESYVNRLPVTCSSFIERPDKTSNRSHLDQDTKTIIIEERSESSKNQNTINLDDNENNTNTINIDQSSSQLSMELTAVSSRTPVTRSFQRIIRQSFDFAKADIPGHNTEKSSVHKSTNDDDSSSKKIHNSKIFVPTDIVQEDCSANTVKTSLNVNTSLDDSSLAERIIHKENEKSNHTTQLVDQASLNIIAKEGQTLTTMPSSLRVNTSIDSIRKSSDNNKTDLEKIENVQLQPATCNNNNIQQKETISHRQSNGTVRTSMQVNTSLDSVKKSPDVQPPLNFNKILSMVIEAPSDNSQNLDLQCQSSETDSETEYTPLAKRIQNRTSKDQDSSKKRRLEASGNEDERKSSQPSDSELVKSKETENSKLENKRKSHPEDSDLKSSRLDTPLVKHKSTRKSKTNSARRTVINEQSVTTNESSVVEATPFPASRSLLLKTMIKNNIAMNTLDPRKLVSSSDDDEPNQAHLATSKRAGSCTKNRDNAEKGTRSDCSLDTVILNSSDESSSGSSKHKEKVIIEESLNGTGNQSKSKTKASRRSTRKRVSIDSETSDEEEKGKKRANKRKLYPLRENSQISFSPAEIPQAPRELSLREVKRKKNKNKLTKKKQENVKAPSPNSDDEEDEIPYPEPEKKKKKPRRIKSKKIVVKKVTNLTLLDNIMEIDEQLEATKDGSSLQEFDLRSGRSNKGNKHHKIVIVVTGLEKEDKDLVKNVIKTLGSAVLQANVTPRTTHVVSSGVRTINLLKSIIRGCWLLTLEWALKSLESGKWLDPSPYEMSHFAKAVQVNRRDRQIFGKAYVPELFVTCGLVYIENGTTPPTSTLKELVKTAGGRITENPETAKIVVGLQGLKENWILDSITTGEPQQFEQYQRQ